jgi:NMT1-like family
VVIAAGNPEGGYMEYARHYVHQLEHLGVQTQLVFDDSWTGVSTRFAKPADEADVGFVQGLYSHRLATNVQSLATVAREPLWIIARTPGLDNLAQLKGLKIAVGAVSGSSYDSAVLTLASHGVKVEEVGLDTAQGMTAVNALIDGRVGAVMQVLGVQSQGIQAALQTPGLQFMGLTRAEEVRTKEPRLRLMVLPQGAIELRGDVPSRDLSMLSTDTHLVVRDTMHPATQRLLLGVATGIHELPGLLQRNREYPSLTPVDIPLSKQVMRGGVERPLFEDLLPYWWAQLAHLVLVYILPIVLGAILLMHWIPRLFDWRVNTALLHFTASCALSTTKSASSPPINRWGLKIYCRALTRLNRQ